jgi:hypothetical protein
MLEQFVRFAEATVGIWKADMASTLLERHTYEKTAYSTASFNGMMTIIRSVQDFESGRDTGSAPLRTRELNTHEVLTSYYWFLHGPFLSIESRATLGTNLRRAKTDTKPIVRQRWCFEAGGNAEEQVA